MTRRILQRVATEDPGAKEVRRAAVSILSGLDVWQDSREAREETVRLISELPKDDDLVRQMISGLREAVTTGREQEEDAAQRRIRQRAIGIADEVLRKSCSVLQELETAFARQHGELSVTERERAQVFARVASHIATEIYFASGAYDRRNGKEVSETKMRRFWSEGKELLSLIATVGHASAVHHLLETLEAYVAVDPKEVFLLIGRALEAGAKGGYQYESLGAQLFVALVERYLAEYPGLLRSEEECRRALVKMLDIFVQAGWPDARRLTYRLDEIFR